MQAVPWEAPNPLPAAARERVTHLETQGARDPAVHPGSPRGESSAQIQVQHWDVPPPASAISGGTGRRCRWQDTEGSSPTSSSSWLLSLGWWHQWGHVSQDRGQRQWRGPASGAASTKGTPLGEDRGQALGSHLFTGPWTL